MGGIGFRNGASHSMLRISLSPSESFFWPFDRAGHVPLLQLRISDIDSA